MNFLFLLPFILFSCHSIDEKPRESDLAGSYYRVKSGDTLSEIAKKYKTTVEEIMDVNGIDNQRALRVGQALFLPDPDPIGTKIAKLKPPAKRVTNTPPAQKKNAKTSLRIFDFPVPGGVVVYQYSKAKANPYDGIGIKAPRGTNIIAPLDGKVLFVGNDGTKFGLLIIIEHVDPYITVYTHLDRAVVKTGQAIKRGATIGTVGQSGGVSIPHLHFQIRVDQRPQDPKLYLQHHSS